MMLTTPHTFRRVSIAILALVVVASCCSKHADPYPPTDAYDVDAAYENDLPDDAQLMREMWILLRADADTTDSTVILADYLADEAHAHALAGANDDALLFWSEAIRLIERSASDSTRVTPLPVSP